MKGWCQLGMCPAKTGVVRVKATSYGSLIAIQREYYLQKRNHLFQYRIHEYDQKRNEWTELFDDDKFPTPSFNADITAVALDPKTNKVYIRKQCSLDLLIMDINDKQITTKSVKNKTRMAPFLSSGFVATNDALHIIGGRRNPQHLEFDTNLNENDKWVPVPRGFSSIAGLSAIHVPSKDIILLIGGHVEYRYNFGIWIYSLKTKQAKKLDDISFNYSHVSSALTSCENYVIIASKKVQHASQFDMCNENDEIFVLDIRDDNEYKLRKCDIKLPKAGMCNISRIGGIKDKYLVVGWIKELFKSKEFKDLSFPPMYLIQLIVVRYNQEEIHWIYQYSWEDHRHFAINVKQILRSLT